nr:uncharacterized protein LOC111429459 isoform X2 [Onthophagus taurus]XP_022921137.1 uncharacterized protein LOC111429459 isoform X2 [Onthophagus taurus]XP_022921138.1 uncharacterized protein LOC111429459 isoform X2 [Onthophagus taurus]XP_022921139.1 uncharacterized protein LOC111429459 isoform X2 [Onthophagus taurus]
MGSHISKKSTTSQKLKMSNVENWLNAIIKEKENKPHIANISQPPTSSLSEIIESSEKFPINFPIDTIRCKVLQKTVNEENLNTYINSAYPLIHEATLYLYQAFLNHKRQYGNDIEKELYLNMNVVDLVERFLKKRAVYFVGQQDKWMLINKSRGFGNFESVGTTNEIGELVLANCLSYDEIKLSALMSISSYTYFINDGNRMNDGIPSEDKSNIEENGVIIGLIGPRLEKENVMEYQDVVMDIRQNVESNGYGNNGETSTVGFFSNFYKKENQTYDEFLSNHDHDDFINIENDQFFDKLTYSKRLTLSFDTLLLEANSRAEKQEKSSYIHLVGIGLGVWAHTEEQTQIFMDTFIDRIMFLGQYLKSVSDIHFAYFRGKSAGGYKNGDKISIENHPNEGIKILISKREPHQKMIDENLGKLLVVSYAWDGNAFPGNEFWYGSLHGSGDPAAAASTQIAEIHNPYINKVVCGENLHVATKNGMKRIDEYVKEKL